MNLIEVARERLSKKIIPMETPCKPEDELEYCHHNDVYPGQNLLVGVCKYCAGNELGERMRAEIEQGKKAAAYFKTYREQKLWRGMF